MQECTVLFTFTFSKPLSKVHVRNNRSNTDYNPQDIPLHSRIRWSIKLAKNWDTETLKLSEKFKPRVSL